MTFGLQELPNNIAALVNDTLKQLLGFGSGRIMSLINFSDRGSHRRPGGRKGKGAFISESALHFDGDKPNSVRLIAQPR